MSFWASQQIEHDVRVEKLTGSTQTKLRLTPSWFKRVSTEGRKKEEVIWKDKDWERRRIVWYENRRQRMTESLMGKPNDQTGPDMSHESQS